MKSICASLEASLLTQLRALNTGVQAVGLLEAAVAGEVKEEDLSSVQVRVYGVQQPHEAMPMFSVTAEIRLNMEQAESANGGRFVAVHEAVALWLQRMMICDECVALDTAECHVDGLQLAGGDLDFDTSGGVWYAVWNMTLTGRLVK